MEIEGITAGKLAAKMQERGAEICSDGELMVRGGIFLLALSEKLAEALIGEPAELQKTFIDKLQTAIDETKRNAEKLGEAGACAEVELSPAALQEIKREPRLLGLVPAFVVATQRIVSILDAMRSYLNADRPIPSEWFDELESQSRTVDRFRENREI